MKKFIPFLSLVLGLFVSQTFIACGGDSEEDDSFVPVDGQTVSMPDYQATFTFINGAKEVELTKATDQMGSIPEYVDYKGKQFRVTRIGDRSCQHLQYAFSEIPEGVVSIGEEAFEYHKATSIKLPSTLKTIGAGAFCYNNNLENIAIPNGVTIIEPNTFLYNKNLISVTIPSKVAEIKEKAFSNTGLNSIVVPGSVKTIGEECFINCTSLKTATLEDGVTSIAYGAFSGCSKLAEISLPSSLTNIGEGVFFSCKSLVSITIPENVKSIGARTFCDAERVQGGVVISSEDCLKEVISKIKEPFPIAKDVFGYNFLNYGILYVPKGTAEKYKTTEGWKEIKNIVEQ